MWVTLVTTTINTKNNMILVYSSHSSPDHQKQICSATLIGFSELSLVWPCGAQMPVKRSGPSEVAKRVSQVTPQSTRQTNMTGSESDSNTSSGGKSKAPIKKGLKVIERKSPRSPALEKKRPTRLSELEAQLSCLQEDLKKAKDQLASSQLEKRKAQQECEEAKKQLITVSAKLEDTQQQLHEMSESEDERIMELRKLGQERDRAWQSELEAVQQQHKIDGNALVSAMNEIQRLRLQLEMVARSEEEHSERAEIAYSELEDIKKEMTDTLSLVDSFRMQLKEYQKSELEYQELLDQKNIKVENLKSALEGMEMLHQEDQIKSTMQLHCTVEELERVKIESGCKEAELACALEEAKTKSAALEASLQLMQANKDFEPVEKNVLDMETNNKDPNEFRGSDLKDGFEMSKQLEAAQTGNLELELELKRVKVQSEQWRKAAETAAAILVTGSNDRFMEKNGYNDYQPFADVEDELLKKKNNMMKRIGVLWKKGQK